MLTEDLNTGDKEVQIFESFCLLLYSSVRKVIITISNYVCSVGIASPTYWKHGRLYQDYLCIILFIELHYFIL